jgi:hypothetical protein
MEVDDVEKKEKCKMERRRSYCAQKVQLWRGLLGK